MATKRSFELTPERLAKQEARRARKLLKQSGEPTPVVDDNSHIVERPWIRSTSEFASEGKSVKVLTWNLLAQCLVRRELFPTSNCLKAKERERMTFTEMFTHSPDIMCLQEVDRLEKILPALEKHSYSHHYAAGPKKKHGCLIAFKKDLYTQADQHIVHYDNEYVREDGPDHTRIGASFRTKNIGLIVALKATNDPDHGVIVATTHLFWHPRYTYERARQAGLLKRAILEFRSGKGLDRWPCILGGDFNFAPNDPAYALLVGEMAQPDHAEMIQQSQVVHVTIDPSVSSPETREEGEGDEDSDPDKKITHARRAQPADGLLSLSELLNLFQSSGQPLRSMYDEGLRAMINPSIDIPTFSDRSKLPSSRMGAFEPEWTSYTHYWKTVLDYIFVIDTKDTTSKSVVTGLLTPHLTKTLEPGLPQLGVCGSDHVSLCAEILFPQ